MSEIMELLIHNLFKHGFSRSKKGNLWRMYEGRTIAVFQKANGLYSWSIADEYGPRYSKGEFESEEEALGSLQREVDFRYVLNRNRFNEKFY